MVGTAICTQFNFGSSISLSRVVLLELVEASWRRTMSKIKGSRKSLPQLCQKETEISGSERIPPNLSQ